MMITKGMLMQVYSLLSQAQLDRCEVKERIEVVKVLRKARQEVEAVQGFVDDVRNKNQDIIAQGGDGARMAELNKAVNDELAKPAETTGLDTLGGSVIDHLIDSNPKWTAAAIIAVEDAFGSPSKSEE